MPMVSSNSLETTRSDGRRPHDSKENWWAVGDATYPGTPESIDGDDDASRLTPMP